MDDQPSFSAASSHCKAPALRTKRRQELWDRQSQLEKWFSMFPFCFSDPPAQKEHFLVSPFITCQTYMNTAQAYKNTEKNEQHILSPFGAFLSLLKSLSYSFCWASLMGHISMFSTFGGSCFNTQNNIYKVTIRKNVYWRYTVVIFNTED